MLGLAPTVGNDFCYRILTEPTKKKGKPKVLVRSVVHCHYEDDAAPIIKYDGKEKHLIFLNDDDKEIGPEFVLTDKPSVDSATNNKLHQPIKAPVPTYNLNQTTTAFACSLTLSLDEASIESTESLSALNTKLDEEGLPNDGIPTITQDDSNSVALDLTNGLTSKTPTPIPEEISTDVYDQDDPDINVVDSIVGHKWREGELLLQLKYRCGDTECQPCSITKEEHPCATTECALQNQVDGGGYQNI